MYKGTKCFRTDNYLSPLSIGGHTKPWQVWRAAVTSAKSWDCLQPANPGEMGFYTGDENLKQRIISVSRKLKEICFQGKQRMSVLCFKPCASLSLLPSKTTNCMSFIGLWTTHNPHIIKKQNTKLITQPKDIFCTDPWLFNNLSFFSPDGVASFQLLHCSLVMQVVSLLKIDNYPSSKLSTDSNICSS